MSSIKGMVSCAYDMGYKSLALTDHGTCAGLLQFQKACKEKGIKPILGNEAYICPDIKVQDRNSIYHLVLLAKNEIGYKNLIYLSSYASLHGTYYKPRIDFETLAAHKEGLIVSSACSGGEISRLIWDDKKDEAEKVANKYKEVFGDDFYLEIMMHSYFGDKEQENKERKLANIICNMGKRLDIKVIATQDSHYTRKEDWEAHDVLLSIQTIQMVKNPNRLSFHSNDFYLKPYEQMYDLFGKVPSVLSNTLEINEKIENKDLITESKDLLPVFKLPEGVNSEEDYLKSLVKRGMEEKGLLKNQEYRDRIKMEMEVITRCKYTRYFLILWDIVNFARSSNIATGCGRGSAVGSLCLYVLDVTKIDPIKYELIFERFLNPERISPPDVDMDFDYYRRNEIYDYIIRKYGADYCCQIGTYNKFKARAVIRASAKALDIGNDWELYQSNKTKSPNENIKITKKSLFMADEISKKIPFKPNMTIELALKTSDEFREAMGKYPKLLDSARRIEGTISSAGVHPAGILLCKDPVIEKIPLRRTKDGSISSQFDGGEVEKVGLLKFDLLALKTLTVIDRTVKLIKERHPDNIPKSFDIDKLDPYDVQVFKMLNGQDPQKGTLGVFQFESPGISKLLADIKVTDFNDMIVANALYRPGPLGAGMHDMYCNYKHGRKPVEYIHPKMGEVLKDTFGIMIFQENIMKISRAFAGFTGGQSDSLRKAVGKKDKVLLQQMKELFIEGCTKNNIDKKIAQDIFSNIEYFGDYGFNKSHSAAYAFMAYQCAWLKVYYPLEFMCNLLSSEIHNNDQNEKLNMYINEAQKMKIGCSMPDINHSGLEFKIATIITRSGREELGLVKPLTFLKGVGEKAVESIVKGQPYKNLEDFISRTDARIVNTRVFQTLVDSGCMDHSWKIPRNELVAQYSIIKDKIDKEKKAKKRIEDKLDKNKEETGGRTIFDEFQDFSIINL
jgi:DNA polymerase-3 subunit alpha